MTDTPSAPEDESYDGISRRSLRNIVQKPKLQLRFGLYIMGSGLFVLLAVFSVVLYMLSNIMNDVLAMAELGPAVHEAVQQAIISAWVVFGIVIVAFVFLSITLGVIISHRIAGPIVPIRRALLRLRDGDYSVSGNLRENDELREIMADINELARTLQERHGSVAGASSSDAKTAD